MVLLGGIGLFLLGMMLLTDGLKAFAGDALRKALLKFTGRPVSAFISGALVTSLVQSSSATTLATIGFVSAGLIGFHQSVGIVFGASLGTTSTGWIVSTLGLKFSVGVVALPLVGAGALLRLLGRGKWSHLGWALAGFGLIFVGIGYLQSGMDTLSGWFDLSGVEAGGFFGKLLLLLIGIAMTVIMQSSSAAIATTLTALHAGAINFDQAAALVIGQAIGTTVTAALAAIGATAAAKRTALAHITFNLATGLMALVLLPVLLWVVRVLIGGIEAEPGPLTLACFHTLFIATGVAVFLPFTVPFANLIQRLVPDRSTRWNTHLDRSLLEIPVVALAAATKELREVHRAAHAKVGRLLNELSEGKEPEWQAASWSELAKVVEDAQAFLAAIPNPGLGEREKSLQLELLHGVDHLGQLFSLRFPWSGKGGEVLSAEARVFLEKLVGHAAEAHPMLRILNQQKNDSDDAREQIERSTRRVAACRRDLRPEVLEASTYGKISPERGIALLDQLRWIDGIVFHLWRSRGHLLTAYPAEAALPQPPEPVAEKG